VATQPELGSNWTKFLCGFVHGTLIEEKSKLEDFLVNRLGFIKEEEPEVPQWPFNYEWICLAVYIILFVLGIVGFTLHKDNSLKFTLLLPLLSIGTVALLIFRAWCFIRLTRETRFHRPNKEDIHGSESSGEDLGSD